MRAVQGFAILLLVIGPWACAQSIPGTTTLAIRNVTIIDPASGGARPSMTIVIGGSRIASINPVTVPPPPGATVVDGSGRYAIPGLWGANDFGSIAEGRLADLVLLDANPLQDVSAIRKIHAVIFNGKPYSRTDLDGIQTDVITRAAAARAKRH